MLTQIPGPDQHFNAYYQDNSLLIQFVIAEFVQTHRLICQIKTLADEYLHSIQHLEKGFNSLFNAFSQLLGQLSYHERLSNSRWTKGPLTKLKEYCEQFSHNHSNLDQTHLVLHAHVHQAWLSAVYHLELLSSLRVSKNQQKPSTSLSHMKRTVNSLHNRLNSMIKQMPRVINLYLDNENVIFFLIRRQKQLMDIYGFEGISKFFKPLIKIQITHEFLIERYKARGFNHLLPKFSHENLD